MERWIVYSLFAVIFLTKGVLTGVGPTCPKGWYPRPGTSWCYQFNNKVKYSWIEADERCTAHGASLLKIEDVHEKVFIAHLVHNGDTAADGYLIGLHSNDRVYSSQKTWLWTDNTTWSYATRQVDWESGYPTSTSNSVCVYLKSDTGKMQNVDCTLQKPFICKRSLLDPLMCEDAYVQMGDFCYQDHDWTLSGADANDHCISIHDGILISITNMNENQYVRDVLNKNNMDKIWIGATLVNGTLEWYDTAVGNSTITPQWGTGEPRMVSSNETYCVSIWKSDYKWHTGSCTEHAGIVCKKPTGNCHSGWSESGGYCYQFNDEYDNYVTWFDAYDVCIRQNSFIATVNSQDENKFLYYNSWSDMWFGVTDNKTDGQFYWADTGKSATSTTPIYENWFQGEPINTPNWPDCGYADMSYSGRGVWHSTPCNNSNYFSCKAKVGTRVKPIKEEFADFECPAGWTKYAHNCYMFVKQRSSWLLARDNCRSNFSANLVSFFAEEEAAFVNGMMKSPYWIGLNNRADNTKWVWDDSVTPKDLGYFKYWSSFYPDTNNENNCVYSDVYTAFYTGSTIGRWKDTKCSEQKFYVCKQEAQKMEAPDVEPTGTAMPWPVQCGPYWEYDQFTKTCYRASEHPLSWLDAESACVDYGGHLASLHGPQDTVELLAYIRRVFQGDFDIWIGAGDRTMEGGFTWSDATALNYINWAAGEPNNGRVQNTGFWSWSTNYFAEDCVVLKSATGQWADQDCKLRRPYVCKKLPAGSSSGQSSPSAPRSPAPGMSFSCPDSTWKEYGNNCYFLDFVQRNYDDAKKECRRRGGDLASIHTRFENSFVSTIPGILLTWIGLNQLQSPGLFTYLDASSVDYTNWVSGEPHGARVQDLCVQVKGTSGYWWTNACNGQHQSLCMIQKQWLAAPTGVPVDSGCAQGWLAWDASCYLLQEGTNSQTYSSAKFYCGRLGTGAGILTIDNVRENAFVTSVLAQKSAAFWLGIESSGSSFKTWNGGSVSYSNWNENHPDTRIGTCATISSGLEAGLWQSASCYNVRPFICEAPRSGISTTPAPPPPTTAPPEVKCPFGFTRLKQSCYAAFTSKKTWAAAKDYCATEGADLASIHSDEENNFIKNNIYLYWSSTYWIGLNTLDRTQKWSDNTGVDFLNYGTGQPNNAHGNEQCFEFDRSGGTWSDANCYIAKGFICKGSLGAMIRVAQRPTPKPAAPECLINGEQWESYGGNCYYLSRYWDTKNFYDARRTCQQKITNSDLLSIHNLNEENLIIGLLSSQTYTASSYYWLGLAEIDVGQGQGFGWSDGTPYDFTAYWAPGHPNDGGASQTLGCSSLNMNTGEWHSYHCGKKLPYICKRQLNPSPVPTSPPKISGNCPPGWTLINGQKCIYIFGDDDTAANRTSWKNALTACKSLAPKELHPNLLSIPDQAFQVELTVALYGHDQRQYWIGLTSLDTQGELLWSDNSAYNSRVANWQDGQPTSSWDKCTEVEGKRGPTTAKWAVWSCYYNQGFICQQDPSPNNPTQAPPTKTCANGFTYKLNSCYKIEAVNGDWDKAQKACQAYGGDNTFLASVTNMYEQALLQSMVINNGAPLWIGLADRNKDQRYEWADSWPMIFSNWKTGEPTALGGQGCVIVRADGYWEDVYCNQTYSAICKYTMDVKPTMQPASYCSGPRYGCPKNKPGMQWFDGGSCYCYALFSTPTTEPAAQQTCWQNNANLISIDSTVENDWIYTHLVSQQKDGVWTGLVQTANRGGFKWTSGMAVSYTNWAYTPSAFYSDDCVYISKFTGKWWDQRCTDTKPFICKVRKEYRPEPTWAAPPICNNDQNWKLWNGSCYYLSKSYFEDYSWRGCRAQCLEKGAELASIHTEDENQFVKDLMKNWGVGWNSQYWIGLNKLFTEDQSFSWSDDSVLDYLNWKNGEPSDTEGAESCTEMFKSDGKWGDNSCARKSACVCKRSVSGTVTPRTTPRPTIQEGGCPEGWISYPESTKCYKLVDTLKSWEGARTYCRQQATGNRGDLLSISSSLEQDFITTQLPYSGVNRWIGLRVDASTYFAYKWMDQSDFSYYNWASGEPNGRFSNQMCVEMYAAKDKPGKWNDASCNLWKPFICQIPKDHSLQLKNPFVNSSCPAGYFYFAYTDSCYKVLDQPMHWEDGEKKCGESAAGAHIVSINSAYEEAAVRVLMGWTQVLDYLWIGMHRENDYFKWSDGRSVRYTHWAYGQPTEKEGENCVRMLLDGSWQDSACQELYLMCKYSTAPIPTPAPSMISGDCPTTSSGALQWQDSGYTGCYLLETSKTVSAAEAMLSCRKKGGFLASIHEVGEVEFLKSITEHFQNNLWIGLTKPERGPFEWADASPVDFTNWAKGEPNNKGGNEDCVEFDKDTGLWADISCGNSRHFICRANKIPVTIPPDSPVTSNPFRPAPAAQGSGKGIDSVTLKPTTASLGGAGVFGVIVALAAIGLLVGVGVLFFRSKNSSPTNGGVLSPNGDARPPSSSGAEGSNDPPRSMLDFLKLPKSSTNAAATLSTANLSFDNATYSVSNEQAGVAVPDQNPTKPGEDLLLEIGASPM